MKYMAFSKKKFVKLGKVEILKKMLEAREKKVCPSTKWRRITSNVVCLFLMYHKITSNVVYFSTFQRNCVKHGIPVFNPIFMQLPSGYTGSIKPIINK